MKFVVVPVSPSGDIYLSVLFNMHLWLMNSDVCFRQFVLKSVVAFIKLVHSILV